MKSLLICAVLMWSFLANAKDDHASKDEHTANVCSAADAKVCAHIGHMSGMKAKSDSSFMVHIMAPKPVTDFKMDLWMPEHGHGTTTPITVTPEEKPNMFKVTKAEFSMGGNWVARLSFNIDKVSHKIEIPLPAVTK